MPQKSQLNVFFIICILILLVVFLALQVKEEAQKPALEMAFQTPEDAAAIRNFMEGCLQQTGEDAIYYSTFHGLYAYPPQESIYFLNTNFPIYWKENNTLLPDTKEIEQQLSWYIEEHIWECLNDFKGLEELGFLVEIAPFEVPELELIEETEEDSDLIPTPYANPLMDATTTHILNEQVRFNLNQKVTVKKGDAVFSLQEFSSLVNINLNSAIGVLEQILLAQEKVPDAIPLSEIASLAQVNNLKFEVVNYDANTVLLTVAFEVPFKDLLISSFALEYDWTDEGFG